MEKVKLLIDKYNLPEPVAKCIVRDFQIEELYQTDINPKSDPEKNKFVIDKIITSEPDYYSPDNNVYALKQKLSQIDFVINGQTYKIDDLLLIEQIRQVICKTEFIYTPKYRKITTRKLLKKIAEYIIDSLPENQSMYSKHLTTGLIFKEFRKDWNVISDNANLITKVKNLLKA